MKGVFSSADALLDYEAMQALFPDTPYRFESGGHPNAIPELTQEAFEHFHTTYYSPENAFIYLYGDMDIEATLQYLNDDICPASNAPAQSSRPFLCKCLLQKRRK